MKSYWLCVIFPGQYFDEETGHHYNYFRDYDPKTGRYIQSDPIGLGDGPNTYTYAQGNSVNFYDSTGMAAEGAATGAKIGGTIGGLIGGVGGAAGGGVLCTPAAPGVGTVGCGTAGGLAGAAKGAAEGAAIGALIGSLVQDAWNMCMSRNGEDDEGSDAETDDSCEELYQSILRTCSGLTGRKKFRCFEAARIARDQCYQER